MELQQLLKMMVERGGSDMFFTTGAKISLKINGNIEPISEETLSPGITTSIANQLMQREDQKEEFKKTLEMNLALSIPKVGRFRVNIFKQRNDVALVIRSVKTEIPTMEQLKLPPILKKIISNKRGLILMVGATGSGKSTSLAAMIDYRNEHFGGHILTIEDPIEFIHHHKKSLINQREIGTDTLNFENALKNAMREAPDVILIGEILDQATMEAAIAFSETGHLCLATLHANNSNQAIDRILNFFPETAHKNILMNLSLNLKGIISQRLIKTKNGNRVPAVEVLLNTPYIEGLIRSGEVHTIKEAMEESIEEGMETFDKSLFKLARMNIISEDEALNSADSREGLELKFRLN